MGILFIDANADKLDEFKISIGEEGNHFVAGLNDALMLLETVTEFDLAVVNYDLEDATGKDLHENFRMLPETEEVPILFYLSEPDPIKEAFIQKMDQTELMVSPSIEALTLKINDIFEKGTPKKPPQEDSWANEDTQVPGDNQPDMEALMAEMAGESPPSTKEPKPDAQGGIDDLFAQMNEPVNEAETSQKELAPALDQITLDQKYEGDLKEHPIITLLESAMSQDHITHIKLTNDLSEEVCDIYIQDQNIVDVEMEGFDLEDALFWVLNWENGAFEIELIEKHDRMNTEIPLDDIISEVVLKRQEFEELSETLPDLKTILIPPTDYNPDTTDIEQEYREILRHFDGEKSINDVLGFYIDNNLYALALISQLYMDELLVENEAEESIPDENNDQISPQSESDDQLLAQYGIDQESLKQEKEQAKLDPTIETGVVEQENIDHLFSQPEPNIKPIDTSEIKDDILSIDTDILEQEHIEIAIDKEAYISEIVNSFKYEDKIEFKEKTSLYLGIIMALGIVTIAISAYVYTLDLEPKTSIYNTFVIDKPPIEKIEILNLGVDNKVSYLKNQYNAVQELLNDQILKRHRKITHRKKSRSKKYGIKLREANYLIKKGNYKQAILIYNNLLKSMPDNSELLLYLAAAHYSDEDNEEALKVIEKLDMLQFRNGEFLLLKAQVYETENDFINAIKYYQEYLKDHPKSSVNREINTIIRTLAKSAKIPLIDNN